MGWLIDTFDAVRYPFLSAEKINEINGYDSPFHREVLRGNPKRVLSLVKRGAKIGIGDISAAIRKGHDEIVTNLLDASRMDINAPGGLGSTLLHDAAATGNDRIVEMLLKRGADVNARNGSGQTPLHSAAIYSKSAGTVKKLIQNGADVLAQDNMGWTPQKWVEHGRDTYNRRGSILIGSEVPLRDLPKDNHYEQMIALLSKPDGISPAARVTAGKLSRIRMR